MKYDVAIIGGGLAGSTLAIHLKRKLAKLNILVVEKAKYPLPLAAHKVGESTVEVGAYYFSNVINTRAHLDEIQLPKLGIRLFFDGKYSLDNRGELGSSIFPKTPSWQIDRGSYENFLKEEAELLGVEFLSETTVKDIDETTHDYSLKLSKDRIIESKWVVDASGRNNFLSRRFSTKIDTEHTASSVWFRVKGEVRIDDWSNDPSWKSEIERWYSTNHFVGNGYWVWVIPLSGNSTSIGIVYDEKIHSKFKPSRIQDALKWLEEFEPQCAKEVKPFLRDLQDFRVLRKYSYKIDKVFSEKRWGLTGEAAGFLDPLYSPGSDFIAYANSFLVDLIEKDLKGEPILSTVSLYNQLFSMFFDQYLSIYNDQYGIFRSQTVIPFKILWDYAVYWSGLAYIFCQNKISDLNVYSKYREELIHVSRLNIEIQNMLREWAKNDTRTTNRVFIDMASHPYMSWLNKTLESTDEDFDEMLGKRLSLLNRAAQEICDYAKECVPDISTPVVKSTFKGDLLKETIDHIRSSVR